MAIGDMETKVDRMFSPGPEEYDAVVDVGTFGLDRIWKAESIIITYDLLNRFNITRPAILDMASGTGRYTSQLKKAFDPKYIIGIDITENMVNTARKAHPDIEFMIQSADNISMDRQFDLITSWYLPKYVESKKTVRSIYNALNDGGIVVLADFIMSKDPIIRFTQGGMLNALKVASPMFPRQKDMFVELPGILYSTKWVDEYNKEFDKSFREHGVIPLALDGATLVWARK